MQYSKIFFFAILSFIFGILAASFLAIPKFIIWEFFILGAFYSALFIFLGLRCPDYRKFLKGIAFGLCLIFFSFGLSRAQIVSLPIKPAPSYFNNVKGRFREVININLPNPQSAILAGILLGDKASFSREWKQKLSNTGTSHIVAVSGMNIVMLSSILVALGVAFGLYRGQSLFFSLILIWLFIALIGFQVSAIRAGIMGSILILCHILGRSGASLRVLVLAVAVMLLINPNLLRHSLSFQLSVLATLGLIQLSPVIKQKIRSETIAVALSAQIFTLPLLIYNFGSISLASLPVNLIIVPLLPIVMVLGIGFLLGGLVYSPLGVVLSWPVGALLSFIVWVIDIFSKIPFAVLRV